MYVHIFSATSAKYIQQRYGTASTAAAAQTSHVQREQRKELEEARGTEENEPVLGLETRVDPVVSLLEQ